MSFLDFLKRKNEKEYIKAYKKDLRKSKFEDLKRYNKNKKDRLKL